MESKCVLMGIKVYNVVYIEKEFLCGFSYFGGYVYI